MRNDEGGIANVKYFLYTQRVLLTQQTPSTMMVYSEIITTRDSTMHQFVRSSNELLRKKGYRLTPQRYMILSVIQEANEHLSVEQIQERVQKRNPYVSLST